MNKDFIELTGFSTGELRDMLRLAGRLKEESRQGVYEPHLQGKTLAMIFEKPSNRTLVSFDVGMYQLGGHTVNLHPSSVQLGGRESIADVARTLSRFVNGAVLRTFSHQTVTEFAKYAAFPVVNGLTDYNHPCQAMADVMTIYEHLGREKDITVAYCGDGNNVLNSLINICSRLGIVLKAACPPGYQPDSRVVSTASRDAVEGSAVIVTEDPAEAVAGADVVYTDVWASMGQEDEIQERRKIFAPYQLNSALVQKAKPQAIVMHCLPAHRGDEITDDVIDGPQSVVFDQAENRLHAQKAVLVTLMKGR